MRMKVLHALAIGKAVVTTPRGADGLLVGEVQPPVVIAEDAKEFAQAVAGLLSCREKRLELGAQARDYAQTHFSAQAYAQRIDAIYSEMKKER